MNSSLSASRMRSPVVGPYFFAYALRESRTLMVGVLVEVISRGMAARRHVISRPCGRNFCSTQRFRLDSRVYGSSRRPMTSPLKP